MVDACTRAAWHEGSLKGVPRLPLFLSKNQVPLGFNLDAKHPDSKLAILEDWVDNAQPTLATHSCHGALLCRRKGDGLGSQNACIFSAYVA